MKSIFDTYPWRFFYLLQAWIYHTWNYKILRRTNETIIPSEVKKHIGQLVIMWVDNEITRLIGLSEDDSDFYYIVMNEKKNITGYSAVSGYIPLKDRLGIFEYARFDEQWNHNGLTYECGLKIAAKQNHRLLI